MPKTESPEKCIFNIKGDDDFNAVALEIFRCQIENNEVYKDFTGFLQIDTGNINHHTQIPFLPVEFFKSHKVVTGEFIPEITFESSGTTGLTTSRHFIRNVELYEKSFIKSFELFFGRPEDYVILALLPSYLERGGSSLVYMADKLIKLSGKAESGFYLDEYEKLSLLLQKLKRDNRRTILLGVTYALLDLAEQFPVSFPGLMIIETGGMKGRRKEMVREDLHKTLKRAFHVEHIYSEYGMTELLSQAYSRGEGIFATPPWMKILIRDTNDPLTLLPAGKSGGINIIDLANIHSCAFISTQDLGKTHENGTFEVLGRFDNSDVRGCNLMVV